MLVMRMNKKGFGVIEVFIILVVLGLLGAVGYYVFTKHKNGENIFSPHGSEGAWMRMESGWEAHGKVPDCPNPLSIPTPTDMAKVQGILYPGQYRGGNYKPHGGLKLADNTNNSVTVTLPTDAYLYKGSRYIEQGEVQYMLVFIDPCGIMYKFDHLYTLSPEVMKIVDEKFPPAQENNSQTTDLNPVADFKAGATIATGVGFKKTGNTTFDFGVYDLRSKNEISKNGQWMNMHNDDQEYAPYAMCWLNVLANGDAAKAKGLPAVDGVSGSISDVCQTSMGNTVTNTVGNSSSQSVNQSSQ